MYQLDIFQDSQQVQCANEVIAALARFDVFAARQALACLLEVDSEHEALERFRVLCCFLEGGALVCDTLAAVVSCELKMRQQIVPAAMAMGSVAEGWLQKCWEELGKSSERTGVPPQQTECFAAELYLRAHQFSDVVRIVQPLPGADFRLYAQRWLALGYSGCGETGLSRTAIMRYAWLYPQGFKALVEEMDNEELSRDWRDFQADLGDLEADWFPAWCAHENRDISARLDNLPDTAAAAAYRLVTGLAMRERGGIGSAVYEDRARLKRLDDSFFVFYMQRRA